MPIVISSERKGNAVVVTVEGPDPADVSERAAKVLALEAAQKHIANCGLGEMSGPYLVHADGTPCDEKEMFGPKPDGAMYRQDFNCPAGL